MVNTTFGHGLADRLLRQVADRLNTCVRDEDTVSRFGSDEFMVVLAEMSTDTDAAIAAQRILDSMARELSVDGQVVDVKASIGIAVAPQDGTNAEDLIKSATAAVYQAKERGHNNYQFYMPEMNRRTREMLSMQAELRHALERDEFVLHYQPKVGLVSRQVSGLEALLRWNHPERGLVSPGAFIPLLEESLTRK